MTRQSMTGFASLRGSSGASGWAWEARSVNNRGLDLRLRLPDGVEALEAPIRAAFGQIFTRGSITVSLRLERSELRGLPRLSSVHLEAALDAAEAATNHAAQRGLVLAPMSTGELLGIRGILEQDTPSEADNAALIKALSAEIASLAAALREAREAEGARLARLMDAQVARIADLVAAAREASQARDAGRGAVLRERVAAVLETTDIADEARLAQELALIAVKADVTEELDRLQAHIVAARDLLEAETAIGRKFDFLTQEFNREANTLCSKSGSSELTAIGLEMKVAIDQMREQVQNVE